jgi:putative membrane protein
MPDAPRSAADLLLGSRVDAVALLLTLVLGVAYGLGVRRVRRRGMGWPGQRSAAWGAGCTVLLTVTVGGVGRYAHSAFWVLTLQVVTLLLVVPVLLAYGRPLVLAVDALPDQSSVRLALGMTGPAVRAATSPLLGPLVVPLVLAGLYFTPLLGEVLRHAWAYHLLHLCLLAVGLLIALGLVGDGTEAASSLALGAAVAVGFVEFLLDAVPGLVLRLRTHLVAPAYWGPVHRLTGTSALHDQQHAGAVLWFVAEFADLPFMAILVRRWIRADARDAARIDRELDDRQRAVAVPGPGEATADGLQRPWWESDPASLRGHRVGRGHRAPPPA